MVESREKFSKLIFRLAFGNIVFDKRAMLLIFYAEYTESVLNILSYLKSTMGWKALFYE